MPPIVVPLAMTSSQGDQQVFSLRTLHRVAEHGSFLTYDFSDDADSVIAGLEASCPDSFANQTIPTLSSDQCDMLNDYLDLCNTIHAQSSVFHEVHSASDDLQSNIDYAMFLLTKGTETAPILRTILPKLQDTVGNSAGNCSDVEPAEINVSYDQMPLSVRNYLFSPYLFVHTSKVAFKVTDKKMSTWFVTTGPPQLVQATLTSIVRPDGVTITNTDEQYLTLFSSLTDLDTVIYASIDSMYSELIVDLPMCPDYFLVAYLQPIFIPHDSVITGDSSGASITPVNLMETGITFQLRNNWVDINNFLAPGLSTCAFPTVLSDEDAATLEWVVTKMNQIKWSSTISQTPKTKTTSATVTEIYEEYVSLMKAERNEAYAAEMSRLVMSYIDGVIDFNPLLFGLVCLSFISSKLIYVLLKYINLVFDPPLGLLRSLGLPEAFPVLHNLTSVTDCIYGIDYVYSNIIDDKERLEQTTRPLSVLKNNRPGHSLQYNKHYRTYYSSFFLPTYQNFTRTQSLSVPLYNIFARDVVSTKQRRFIPLNELSLMEGKAPHDIIYVDGTRPIKFIKDGNGIQLVEISIRDRTDTNIPIRVPHDLYQNVVNMVDRSASTEQCRAELQRIIEGQFKLSKQLNGERNYNSTRAITYQKRQKAAKQSATDEEGHSDNSLNSTTSPTCLTASLDHGKISSTKKVTQDSSFIPILCEPRDTAVLLSGATDISTTMVGPICHACFNAQAASSNILGVIQTMIDESIFTYQDVLGATPPSLVHFDGRKDTTNNPAQTEVICDDSTDPTSLVTKTTDDKLELVVDDQKLYSYRDIAIVRASCNPSVTVTDLDSYRDICIQFSLMIERSRLCVYFPSFTYHDYISLGLYNNKLHYLHTNSGFHLGFLRFLFDSAFTTEIDRFSGNSLGTSTTQSSSHAFCVTDDLIRLVQASDCENYAPVLIDLFNKFVLLNTYFISRNISFINPVFSILDATCSSQLATESSNNEHQDPSECPDPFASDFIDPASFITLSVGDTSSSSHPINSANSLVQLFSPFQHHGDYTNQSALVYAILTLRFLTTFMGGSLALQEAIRLYTIAASYCMISSIPPLKCSVNLAEVNSDSNALLDETMTLCGSKSSILLINEHNRHLGFSESAQALSLVDHFNEDILHGGYKATINNTFTPLSPFLLSKEYCPSVVQDSYIHTNLRSLQYIRWLSGSNSFRPHTFEESDSAGYDSAVAYIKDSANITDQVSQAFLLEGSMRRKIESWPHYGVSYRVCPNYDASVNGTALPSAKMVIWSKDDIPTDYMSSKLLADSVFNRGKYVTIPYGSESYGSVNPHELGAAANESKQSAKASSAEHDKKKDSKAKNMDADRELDSLADTLSLIKQIQLNPAYPCDASAFTALYTSTDRPVTIKYHFMATTGQEASMHHIEEEQICFGMLRVYINALLRILIEWIAIYAPSLLCYYDVSLSATAASAPPDNTRFCPFGFNRFVSSALLEDEAEYAAGTLLKKDLVSESIASKDRANTPTILCSPFLASSLKEDLSAGKECPWQQDSQPAMSLAQYFSEADQAGSADDVQTRIGRKSLYSDQFLSDHASVLASYRKIESAMATDKILSATDIVNSTDRSLRFLAYPYIVFPVNNTTHYSRIYSKDRFQESDWSQLSPPPPRIHTTLQFFICQVYTGSDVLFSLFTEPLITVPLLARTMQNLLSRAMLAEQRASYVWRTICPDSHFTNCDQSYMCMSSWDKKVLTPKAILQDFKRRNNDLIQGLDPELWPITLDPSHMHLGRLVYPSYYRASSNLEDQAALFNRWGSGMISTLISSGTRNLQNEPQSTLLINFIPRINPYRISHEFLQKSQLIVPGIISPSYATAELVRLYRTYFFSMDEEFVRLVLCRSSMLFSCITTGFTTKTNQSVYDLCGSNPVSEDIYYFATLGYKHLQNAVNTKQYTYPAPISLLDIEQVISGIELTYSSYVSNQKYSEYHYTDEERKSLLEKISLFELDHKGIVKKTEALLSGNVFFHSYDLVMKSSLQDISSLRRHAFMPCVTPRSYKFLLNLLMIDTDEDLDEPGFRNTNSATLIGSLGSLTADGCKNVLLFEIIPAMLLNHESGDWAHSSIDPEKPVYKMICSDIYIILRLVSIICTRIEFCLQILERVPSDCRQVGKYGTRSMTPFPLSQYNGRCAAGTLFGYDDLDYSTPCGNRIFYSSNQYFQLSDTYSLSRCRCGAIRCPYCGGLGSNMGLISGSYLPGGTSQYVELQSGSSNGIFSSKIRTSGACAEDKEACPDTYGLPSCLHDNYSEDECLLNTSNSKTYHCYPVTQTLLYKLQPALPLPFNLLETLSVLPQTTSLPDHNGMVQDISARASAGSKQTRGYKGTYQSHRWAKQDYSGDFINEEGKSTKAGAQQLLERAKLLCQQPAICAGEGYPVGNYGERLVDLVHHLPPLDAYTFRALSTSSEYATNRFVQEYLNSSLGHESVCVSSAEKDYNPDTAISSTVVLNEDMYTPPATDLCSYFQGHRYARILDCDEISDPVLTYLFDPNIFSHVYLYQPPPDFDSLPADEVFKELRDRQFQKYHRDSLWPLEQHILPSHIQKRPGTLPTSADFRGELLFLLRLMQMHVHQTKEGVLSSEFTPYMYGLLGLYAYPLLNLRRPITTLLRRLESFCARIGTTSMNINYLSLYRPSKTNIQSPRSTILFLFLVFATRLPSPYGNLLPLSLPSTASPSDELMIIVENTGGLARFSGITNTDSK
ncbi:hypothetical protein GL50803_0016963 [Giardia duodenalis]|uniref:Uncharacterized protein n=1 Tax=Giardia intestinalis (strain ATCC 50803 / WB clone C6) TaxID=184922 RepID=A8BT82_GIAIC|nr:hypothetical protein GL50803_0016963 [Giardia intestinalis]KAE8302832.1 hypothetical protein GL50803_0016963 [Giardia intestinalis]|eukprot:XP_001704941.1 Hypothetical protein GL50803_16963 [Giardia lamblia ATCC 50803]